MTSFKEGDVVLDKSDGSTGVVICYDRWQRLWAYWYDCIKHPAGWAGPYCCVHSITPCVPHPQADEMWASYCAARLSNSVMETNHDPRSY